MRPGGRIQAAIEVLDAIEQRHRPASLALADWGRAHRFAGSGDRAAIGNLVFDALRHRASLAATMSDTSSRALAIGTVAVHWGEGVEGVSAICDGSTHAPSPLTEDERAALKRDLVSSVPAWVRGDYPEWLHSSLERVFGARAAEEGAGLAHRAPIDLRVNTLKADREKVLKALKKYTPQETVLSPVGIRLAASQKAAKSPHVEAEPGHARGWFEVQDEASQIAALMVHAEPGMQVADICAGAGGKTLALAAAMKNRGQVHAYDADKHRLKPIFDRLKRAGARNTQVIPAGEEKVLKQLADRFDRVVVDSPCTGTGVWRRHPDAKWRLKQANLDDRMKEQVAVLDLAAPLVKSGGRLVYITCSLLAEENNDQVEAFQKRHEGFALVPYRDVWREALATEPPDSADGRDDTLLLTPACHGTDGFFVAVLQRQ